ELRQDPPHARPVRNARLIVAAGGNDSGMAWDRADQETVVRRVAWYALRPACDLRAVKRGENTLQRLPLVLQKALQQLGIGGLTGCLRRLAALLQPMERRIALDRPPGDGAAALTQPKPELAALHGRQRRRQAAIVGDDSRRHHPQQRQAPPQHRKQLVAP